MVTHTKLQHYRRHYGMVCITGLLGCRWHRYKQSRAKSTKCNIFWFICLLLAACYMLFWLYFWILAGNSYDALHWFMYHALNSWFAWYPLLVGLTATTVAYFVCLLVLSTCHIGHGHQLYIHVIHCVLTILTLTGAIVTTIILTYEWPSIWGLQAVSLMITGPFLHIAAVILFTGLAWFVAARVWDAASKVKKVVWMVMFITVMVALYLVPLLIHSPCICETQDLPTRPLFVGHRGASAIRPENTLYSMETATSLGAWGLECDVVISRDGVPYLLHDKTLKRTTNIEEMMPEYANAAPCQLNYSDVLKLDAGSWFLQRNPFGTSHKLEDSEKVKIQNQTVSLFLDILKLAKSTNTSVMFDFTGCRKTLKANPSNDTGVNQTGGSSQYTADDGNLSLRNVALPNNQSQTEVVYTNTTTSGSRTTRTTKGRESVGGDLASSSILQTVFRNADLNISPDMQILLDVIDDSQIDLEQILWFVQKHNVDDYFPNKIAHHPISVQNAMALNVSYINMEYSGAQWETVRHYQEEDLKVIVYIVNSPWLFSLCWCMGVHAVTSDFVHNLVHMTYPVWQLTPAAYLALWIMADIISASLVVLIFVVQRILRRGKIWTPEVINLQAARLKVTQIRTNRPNMKEQLLRRMELDGSQNELDRSFNSLGSASDLAVLDQPRKSVSEVSSGGYTNEASIPDDPQQSTSTYQGKGSSSEGSGCTSVRECTNGNPFEPQAGPSGYDTHATSVNNNIHQRSLSDTSSVYDNVPSNSVNVADRCSSSVPSGCMTEVQAEVALGC